MRKHDINKRGTRAWFESKLNSIESLVGEDVRQIAVSEWAKIVWPDPSQAGFDGARAIDYIHQLASAASTLQDYSAKNSLINLLRIGNIAEINRIAKLFDLKKIKVAMHAQGLNEESIRTLANQYICHDDPTAHLRARRYLRKYAKQSISIINLTLGLIGKNAHKHCSPFELNLRNQQKGRWQKFGAATVLTQGNKQVSMLIVMQSASTNKIAEILTLSKGLESYAKDAGLTWAFITLTAPPAMHPNPSMGQNSWDGTTPDLAHQWIHQAYRKVEKILRKKGIIISGLRVVEPHQDGCPHWHLLVFAHPSDMQEIEEAFRKQPAWKADEGLKFVINDGRAKASSYIFKYVLKTINQVEKLAGEAGTVDAWRSTWAIRAFNWFGMPPIGLWRNLRAIKERPANELSEIWEAANLGDGHAFIRLAGGLNIKKKDRPYVVKTDGDIETKVIEFLITSTGECVTFNIEKWKKEKVVIEKQ